VLTTSPAIIAWPSMTSSSIAERVRRLRGLDVTVVLQRGGGLDVSVLVASLLGAHGKFAPWTEAGRIAPGLGL
jgi:hypothetical protein